MKDSTLLWSKFGWQVKIDLIEKAILEYTQDKEPDCFVEFRREKDLEL